jgi:hypothetical protein
VHDTNLLLRRYLTQFRRWPVGSADGNEIPCPRSTSSKLPKAEHEAPEWQATMQALMLVGENDGPTMFARIGIMRALNRHVEGVFDSSRIHGKNRH